MHDLAKIIGQRIRNYRTAQNLSQEKLAELCGISPRHYQTIEAGKTNPRMECFLRLCEILDLKLEDLFPPKDEEKG